jgi:hypothetical protein
VDLAGYPQCDILASVTHLEAAVLLDAEDFKRLV